jgi:hypothetical protein
MRALLEQLAGIIQDYREGAVARPTADHVEHWINQFDRTARGPVLRELTHVLGATYIPKASFQIFLRRLVRNPKICGDDPTAFWRRANFLKVQRGGSSQRDIGIMFDEVLKGELGFTSDDCASPDGPYIYIDDAIFSGSRVIQDLSPWIQSQARAKYELHIIVAVCHMYGKYYADKQLNLKSKSAGKTGTMHWWRVKTLEDRRSCIDTSDVLRPKELPSDPAVQKYVEMLKAAGYAPVLRTGSSTGTSNLFSSADARHLLEQHLLTSGAHILKRCPNLPEVVRPLGFHGLKTLGFGSTLVTFRNCPNTCPPAFWVDRPWYPLFPRRTNTETSIREFTDTAFGPLEL